MADAGTRPTAAVAGANAVSATRIALPLVGAALVIVLMMSASIWSFRQLEASVAARGQAHSTIDEANDILIAITDSDAAMRGYVLTGDEDFLAPYAAAREHIQSKLEALRQANQASAAGKHLDALQSLIAAQLAHISQAIEYRRKHDPAAALAVVGASQRQHLMHSIRAEMRDFMRAADADLAKRDTAVVSNMHLLLVGISVFGLLALLFALAFAYLIYRELQNRARNLAHAGTRQSLKLQEELNSQLQQTNAALQVSEEKLAVTLNSIGDAVMTTDEQGRVTLLNPLAEQLTGWTLAEALGKPVDAIFHIISQDTRQPSVIPVIETLAHGTVHGLANHTILIARNGSECAIADSCAPIRGRDGQVVGAVLVFRDVSSEDATRLALRNQQFYARSLIESNIDAIMTTDPSGIITDVNRQMEMLTGRTRDELIGAPFKNCFTDPGRAEAAIDLVLAEKKVLDYELTARARDGKETKVSYNAMTFYDRERRLQGVFAAARDITERKRLDQALQDKNEELEKARATAEKANLAKSEFLSSMSHELRTPLNAILGFAQLMESATPAPTAAEKRNIARILKAGWFLLELVNEILDLALIESGRVTLSGEPVSLAEVMQECQSMFEPQAQQRGIEMTFPRSAQPYFVKADRTRLKQILINLLFNAIKYNSPSGSVVVEYALHPAESLRANAADSIRISIRDTGTGLAPEELAQLFQPFNRLGREASAEEGTGIGLVVTKRLVELMGGKIGVRSTVGAGSTFWFELEMSAPPQLVAPTALYAAPKELALPQGAPKRTVLYVEDNSANLELVEQLVARRSDLHLLSAVDGEIGIAMARTWVPEVILMDINLPGISGYEALTILQVDPATAHIPVIALSANAMARDVEKGLKAGFFSYLTKPIKVNEFMAALDLALIYARSTSERTTEKEAPA
jgi:PAS domain S-box-containing protein